MEKYFHELTDEEYQQLMDSGITVNQLLDTYLKPDWCNYPGALDGPMGCWSLFYRFKGNVSREYCKDCDDFRQPLQEKDGE
jgi:hypothetical protein